MMHLWPFKIKNKNKKNIDVFSETINPWISFQQKEKCDKSYSIIFCNLFRQVAIYGIIHNRCQKVTSSMFEDMYY